MQCGGRLAVSMQCGRRLAVSMQCGRRLASYLQCAECVENVWVVMYRGRQSSGLLVLASTNKANYLMLVHAVKLSHEIHCSEPPVYATHTQELCSYIFLYREYGIVTTTINTRNS